MLPTSHVHQQHTAYWQHLLLQQNNPERKVFREKIKETRVEQTDKNDFSTWVSRWEDFGELYDSVGREECDRLMSRICLFISLDGEDSKLNERYRCCPDCEHSVSDTEKGGSMARTNVKVRGTNRRVRSGGSDWPSAVCLSPNCSHGSACQSSSSRERKDTRSLSADTFYLSGNIKRVFFSAGSTSVDAGWTDIYRPHETPLQEVVSLSLIGLKLIESAQGFN